MNRKTKIYEHIKTQSLNENTGKEGYSWAESAVLYMVSYKTCELNDDLYIVFVPRGIISLN